MGERMARCGGRLHGPTEFHMGCGECKARWRSGERECKCQRPSSERKNLAFFKEREGEEYDSYYCGCGGWD